MFYKSSLTLFVLLSVIAGAFSTYCYSCNSYNDKDHSACIDPMSPYPQVNITSCSDSSVCTRVSYVTQKQFVVSRGCDPAGSTCENILRTLTSYYPDLSTFNCYWCSGSYCNDVSGLAHAAAITESQLPSVKTGVNAKEVAHKINVEEMA